MYTRILAPRCENGKEAECDGARRQKGENVRSREGIQYAGEGARKMGPELQRCPPTAAIKSKAAPI